LNDSPTASTANPNRERRVWFAAVLALVTMVVVVVVSTSRLLLRMPKVQRHMLVGTWATDGDSVIQLRADGTGAARFPTHPELEPADFMWDLNGAELAFFDGPRNVRPFKDKILGWFRVPGYYHPDLTDYLHIHDVTEEAMLVSRKDRTSNTWARVADDDLD